jgi:hypothetical protein
LKKNNFTELNFIPVMLANKFKAKFFKTLSWVFWLSTFKL